VWVAGKRGGFVLLLVWFLSASVGGQGSGRMDSMAIFNPANLPGSGGSMVRFRFAQDLEYRLSCTNLFFINWQQGDHANLISLFHHLEYRSQFTNDRNVTIGNSFVHDLGIQYFIDSVSRFQPDENTLDTRIEVRIGKNLSYTVFSTLSTRMFNSYHYTTDRTGNLMKTLSASFLTPLLWTFSTGLGWTVPKFGSLSFGLSAAKFTWILNREIYDQQDIVEFYGVPKEKAFMFEYGLSMHFLVDRDFLKRVHWNCDLLIFKNYGKPVDLAMKNFIGVRINKFLKTSIQTRLFYEQEVSKCLQIENLVSLGFYVNL
jgi:hypothetical protein